ncbi:MAG: DNA mismatch repair protein MutS [Deltaproteobacteria bacterium]
MANRGYKLTPVMQQYLEIKAQYEDAILFFRMGDFYEMFFEDAEKAAGLLDIALTTRNRNEDNPIPMCGVPHHAANGYIARLLECGLKVAVCEQVEMPERGLARRAVTRVITPGTTIDEETLVADRPNYLAAAAVAGGCVGFAWAEFSTGQVCVTEVAQARLSEIEEEMAAVAPSELVVGVDDGDGLGRSLGEVLPGCVVTLSPVNGDGRGSGDGLESRPAAQRALNLLMDYLHHTQGKGTAHLRAPAFYETGRLLRLDPATRRNLEITTAGDGGRRGSLISVMDRSVTAAGKRLLANWLVAPLADVEAIGQRLDRVEAFVENFELRDQLRDVLTRVGDLERLAGRIGAGRGVPADLGRLARSLEAVDRIKVLLGCEEGPWGDTAGCLDGLAEVQGLIAKCLADEPPAGVARAGTIRDGFHEEVDRLRTVSREGKGWMARFETEERKRTGISTLKIGYNRVFGYYIEVGRSRQSRVPADYERKQTLANSERYATAELKSREAEVLGAEERLAKLEAHLFDGLLKAVVAELPALSRTAAAAAELDALAGLAETAHQCAYVRPEIHLGDELEIVDGRHPVVEAATPLRFVPNDCHLGAATQTLGVITGPNMAGKSTYLRQVALIALMAHAGSFVPAASAKVPLTDRIFTRIGASDNLAAGRSTFMVEMTETAYILENMSERSLVVLDEIGRGTSTFDGISIAWAVAEAMLDAGVKTLFATHYHELAGLAAEHDGVANFSVAVRRHKGEIIFLYRVVSGATSGSYGIEVAGLAGIPRRVVDNARKILALLEGEGGPGAQAPAVADESKALQLGLFRAPRPKTSPLLEELRNTDVETLSPLEALNLLGRLVSRARGQE